MVKKGLMHKGIIVLSTVALASALAACSAQPTMASTSTSGTTAEKSAAETKAKDATEKKADNTSDAAKKSETTAEKKETSKASSEAASKTEPKTGTTTESKASSKTDSKKDSATDSKAKDAKDAKTDEKAAEKTTDKSTSKDKADSKTDAKTDSKAKAATTTSGWSFDMDCALCHVTEGESMEDETTGACLHVKEAETECTTCHNDEKKLATAHKKATADSKMPKKLKRTFVDAETCQAAGCHDISADELAKLTADVDDCTDSKGTTVNPHEVMGLTPGHEKITCSNCHNMHADEVKAANTCISCHHAGVYECNTCH